MSKAVVEEVVSDSCIRLQTQRLDGSPYVFNFTRMDRIVIAGEV